MTDIYTLGIKADTRDIDRGKTSLDKFGKAADTTAKKTNQMRNNVNMAGKAVATFGAAAAAALGVVAICAGNAALQIEKLSRLSGLNTEEFQKAAFAANKYGIEQDKLADIFKDTQDKIGDFLATGGGELINFFENVAPLANVTRESFKGLTGQQGLQLYVDSLEKANVGQEEMVFFMEAIGNDSTALLPLLRNNGEEFKRIGDRAEQLGIILDEIDLDNLTDMNSALNDLGAVSNAAGNVIGATLAPFITSLSESFIDSAGTADEYRNSILNLASGAVTVAGVFADAGRVFEIFGTTIGASIFEAVEKFSTFEKRLDGFQNAFKLTFAEIELILSGWVNSQRSDMNQWANDVINALDVFDLFDDIQIEPISLIDTEALEGEVEALKAYGSLIDAELADSNAAIEAAWSDVRALIAEPIPSEGFDDWFKKIREGIELTRELAKETKDSGKDQDTTIKGLAKTWDKSLSETGKGVNALTTILGGNEKAQKALHKVSQAIAIAEAFQSIQKMTLGTTEAGVHVANETTKQGANALTAITSAFAAPFPVNFVAGAAMVGIMASLVGGISGGGGSSYDPTDDRQEDQGTGSVLGSSDKSASINKAQERFEDIQIDQLSELRGIRGSLNNIGSGIAQLSKGLITSGAGEFEGFTGSSSNVNPLDVGILTGVGGVILDKITGGFISGVLSWSGFGKTKTDLIDSGVTFMQTTFGNIIDQGFIDAQQYFDTKTKETSWWGLSSSTSFDTAYQSIGSGVNEQIGAIFQDIGSTVLESAKLLGFETVGILQSSFVGPLQFDDLEEFRLGLAGFFAGTFEVVETSLEDALDMFQVDIGKISLEGLSGEEIQAELEAVFSQQADLIAEYLVPSIAEFQQVGEGLFDTLLRVTQEQAVFNDALANMGVSLTELGNVLQIEIAQGIIELVGGAERFSDLTQSFFSDFFSEAEQFDILAGSISDVFGDLGVALSDSRGAFRELVESQDLTTEAGRQLFATLLEIAPAMDSYFDTLEDRAADELALAEQTAADKARVDALVASDAIKLAENTAADLLREQEKAAQEAIRLASEQSNLTIRLLGLQGKAEEALAMSREMQLAATTESLRPLLELIFAEEDLITSREASEAAAITAAQAAQDLADATIKQAEAAEEARQELANAAFTMLNKSIDLEKQRLQAILDVSREAYNAESTRLTGLRENLNAEKAARDTGLANASAALSASFDAEINAINSAKDARINSLNTERSAVASNLQMLLGLADKFSQKITDTSNLDKALAAAKRGDFSIAEQLQVQEVDSGGFGSSSDFNVAQALQANKLQNLSNLAQGAAGQASNRLSGIDRQIASAERSAAIQVALLETQRDSLLGIDETVLPLSESIENYQTAKQALDELAYDDEIARLDMLVLSNEEVYALHQSSYDTQIASLAEIAEAGEAQLNALLNIDTSVLSVADAMLALAQAPALNGGAADTSAALLKLAQDNKDAQKAIAKSSAATAAILQRLELGGLDTRTIA